MPRIEQYRPLQVMPITPLSIDGAIGPFEEFQQAHLRKNSPEVEEERALLKRDDTVPRENRIRRHSKNNVGILVGLLVAAILLTLTKGKYIVFETSLSNAIHS
jgi:hypothetical protein